MTEREQQAVQAAIAAHRERPGALLPLLHAVQDTLGFVPPGATPAIAHALNLSQAEVHGVIGFYPDFRRAPPGRHVLKVCRAEACQSMLGSELERHAQQRLGCGLHETSADGAFTLEPAYCLGNCAAGPNVMLDGALHGSMTPERLDALLLNAGRAANPAHAQAVPPHAAATVFVPQDAAALAAGADAVADAIVRIADERGQAVRIVRNGSRGMVWLEPLVEVATAGGRVAYGPVRAGDVASLFDAHFLDGGNHALLQGRTENIGWLERQQRLTFARCGITDPLSLEDHEAHGGWRGLRRALAMQPADMVEAVVQSGLRGRGGAAFPAGVKWRTVLAAEGAQKYIVCNADEGDSGTFADRMIMEGDPFLLIEGMIIAGLAVGATQGYIYLRSEYPNAERIQDQAIDLAYEAGYLGESVLGSGRRFDLELRRGAGAYICGEETSLLESLEGRRGTVRYKPPLPAVQGLFGKPTAINNVITLVSVPVIFERGPEFYRDFGMGRSRGTLPIQLAGNIRHGGLVEAAFGITVRELLYGYGGGSASGRPIRAVQVGGPLGAYLPESQFDTPLDYEAFAVMGAMVGHGGIVAFDDTVDMAQMARYAMEFCAVESCGKCTPCRIGSTRGVEVVDRIVRGENVEKNHELLRDLCDTMLGGSLCALGGMAPYPVLSALNYFPEDFGLKEKPPKAA
ncbi:MAG: formate dehydrogenase subunit gamma [Burkholderiales bacterium]|nr:formate dehydrogenase subunit gamma [Burkholderiales bacterium]